MNGTTGLAPIPGEPTAEARPLVVADEYVLALALEMVGPTVSVTGGGAGVTRPASPVEPSAGVPVALSA